MSSANSNYVSMESRRNELLTDVHTHTSKILEEHGIDPALADQIGCAISDHLADHWGGQIITIPKDFHYRLAKRDLEIYEQFTGHNYHELARTWKMSERGIYKVIKRVRKNGDPNQPKLF